jgi:hypothetical protein
MGITTVLENEDGTALATVEDPTNVLHHALPEAQDSRYQHLTKIDWYGDTVFNRLQAPQLLVEWRTLESDPQGGEAARVLREVGLLIERLGEDVHAYLKFYGD